MSIELDTENYISLYGELAERRLEAFEFAEYRQNEGEDVFVTDKDGNITHSEWASDQFVEECNVVEEILASHGITSAVSTEQVQRFKKVKDAKWLLTEAIGSVVKEPHRQQEYKSLQIALASINVLVEEMTNG
tara:strand:- start:103 stop:501 length:399 start_codon:yes stop_codon:yes gene_type:complete